MDTIVAMFLIAGGAVALLIVLYASIADKWYKLKDERDNCREQHDRLETLYDRQREMITMLQRQVIMHQNDTGKQPAQVLTAASNATKSNKYKNRSKGFTANNDINVWHKAVPYQALAKVQMRIDEGNKWSNISRSNHNGYVFKISYRNLNYSSQNFSDRNHAKQFRDSVLHKYFHRDRNERGAQP